MRQRLKSFARQIARWLASPLCWRLVLGLFLLETLWFVFTAQYPMAFDENYHFGLIKLHATQWTPFFTVQPQGTGVFGSIVRDPSYLYQWLMSFPYRLISVFTHNQTTQIILLRLINVALFAWALVLYRRIIRGIGVSAALTNSLFTAFILIPVVPFLAAHINYDNLFFLAVPATVLLALKVMRGFTSRSVDATTLLTLLSVMLLSSLIKYAYLPVFVAVVLFVLWRLYKTKLLNRTGLKSFAKSFRAPGVYKQALLVLFIVMSFGLFAERYVPNLVTYHNPVPACDAVISKSECLHYGPYARNQLYASEKTASFHPNIFVYIGEWLHGMWYRLFFAINYTYANNPPLYLISKMSIVLAALLALGIIVRFRVLFAGKPERQLVFWVVVGYMLVLFADGFSAYKQTGRPVAINGRYLIPFLPFIFAFGGLAWAQLLHGKQIIKASAAALVLAILLLQGGGTMTYIVLSNDTWYWNNGVVRSVNDTVRKVVSPIIIGKHLR